MTFNRNDLWRIKRSLQHLDKALDNLTRANGELRPKQYGYMRAQLEGLITGAEALHAEMTKATQPAKGLDLNLDDDQEAAE